MKKTINKKLNKQMVRLGLIVKAQTRLARRQIMSNARKKIAALKKEEDRIFIQTCSYLHMDPNEEPRSTQLFDYLFNGLWGNHTLTSLEKELWTADTAGKSSIQTP